MSARPAWINYKAQRSIDSKSDIVSRLASKPYITGIHLPLETCANRSKRRQYKPIDSRGVTSYLCSIVALGLGGTAVDVQAVKSTNRNRQEQEEQRPVSSEPLTQRHAA